MVYPGNGISFSTTRSELSSHENMKELCVLLSERSQTVKAICYIILVEANYKPINKIRSVLSRGLGLGGWMMARQSTEDFEDS